MKEVIAYLQESGVQYFGSLGLDGSPKVRPFQFMLADGGKLWFCTSNQENIFKELTNHAYIELCASTGEKSWMRLSGKVVFSDNEAIKEKIIRQNQLANGIYKLPDHPFLEVFYLEEVTATINELGGPSKTYTF